mgnify:CR=1 FL=1
MPPAVTGVWIPSPSYVTATLRSRSNSRRCSASISEAATVATSPDEFGGLDLDGIAATLKGASEKTGQPVEELRRQQQAQIPAGRYGHPREFGAICAFLCSQQAGYLNGQNILPDGGLYPGTY